MSLTIEGLRQGVQMSFALHRMNVMSEMPLAVEDLSQGAPMSFVLQTMSVKTQMNFTVEGRSQGAFQKLSLKSQMRRVVQERSWILDALIVWSLTGQFLFQYPCLATAGARSKAEQSDAVLHGLLTSLHQ
jgi:hypothetical protein